MVVPSLRFLVRSLIHSFLSAAHLHTRSNVALLVFHQTCHTFVFLQRLLAPGEIFIAALRTPSHSHSSINTADSNTALIEHLSPTPPARSSAIATSSAMYLEDGKASKGRRAYSAQELLALRGTRSQPNLAGNIEGLAGGDIDVVKGEIKLSAVFGLFVCLFVCLPCYPFKTELWPYLASSSTPRSRSGEVSDSLHHTFPNRCRSHHTLLDCHTTPNYIRNAYLAPCIQASAPRAQRLSLFVRPRLRYGDPTRS